ncbi:MAG: DUF2344 domain-containing protein, partial [Gemmatimonadaceae bacterium]
SMGGGQGSMGDGSLEERVASLLAADELWVARKTKDGPKRINIRPFIRDLTVHPLTRSPARPLEVP